MAGMNYNYDETASSWPYFVLTIAIVALVPVGLSYWTDLAGEISSSTGQALERNGQIKGSGTDTTPIDSELKAHKKRVSNSKIFSKKLVVIAALVAGIVGLIVFTNGLAPPEYSAAFDPFEILDISSSASDREIKSHYRKLSLVFHPDKIARDASETEKAELEAKFVLINKAYKALTDEATKRNYELYGHPDGPQDVSHGIALPSWFVDGSFSWVLTVAYIIGIAVLLPLGVGRWWNTVQSYTKKGIHVETARLFTNRLLNHNPAVVVTSNEILRLVSGAKEFKILFKGRKTPQEIHDMIRAHINRDYSKVDTADTLRVVAVVPKLIAGLIDIASVFRNTEVVLKSIDANKAVIQAINPSKTKYHPLLQLPHVEIDRLDKTFEVYTLAKLLSLDSASQKKFLGVSDAQLEQVVAVASKIPIVKLVKAEFKVPGESVVPPSSHSHLVLKVIVKSAADTKQPVLSRAALQEDEDFESLKNPFKIVTDQPHVPPTHAPYFPYANIAANGWMCSLITQRDNKLSDLPQHFQNLSFANLTSTADGYVVGTLKLQLASTTPPEAGKYQFRCILRSMDYFGNDIDFPVEMEVQNPPAVEEKDAYEIEDPDEDSVAGVMAALKGESVKRSPEYESSSDEESDFDDDDESDFSDLNTDTEDEAETDGK